MRLPIVKHSDDLGVLGVNLVNDQITEMGHICLRNWIKNKKARRNNIIVVYYTIVILLEWGKKLNVIWI